MSIAGLSLLYGDFMKALGASERVFELTDRKPLVRYKGGYTAPGAITGSIELSNVDFEYPSRPDQPVLRSLNLSLRPGQVVALVGPSGAGLFLSLLYPSFKCLIFSIIR